MPPQLSVARRSERAPETGERARPGQSKKGRRRGLACRHQVLAASPDRSPDRMSTKEVVGTIEVADQRRGHFWLRPLSDVPERDQRVPPQVARVPLRYVPAAVAIEQ